MKQTLDLTPSSDALNLDAWNGGSPIVITGTVPAWPTIETWRMQLWKYPHDANEDDAEPLASAVGTVVSGTMTIAFTAGQVGGLTLSDVIGCNNFHLVITGTTSADGFYVIRHGSIEILPAPWAADAPASASAISVEDDWATFTVDGTTYRVPVEAIEVPEGALEGEIVVIDDMAVFTPTGSDTSYTWPVEEVEA